MYTVYTMNRARIQGYADTRDLVKREIDLSISRLAR